MNELTQAFCVGVMSWLIAGTVLAQKAPQVGYVYPPVVRAGESTSVQLGGFDFTPDMQWFVHDDRVKLSITGVPGDYQFTPPPYWVGPRAGVGSLPLAREVSGWFECALSHPGGLVRWQVANANGSSQTAVVYVSHGQEILESRSRDLPQRLPALPVAVSGRLSRLTEVDVYEVVAERDGPISVDVMSRRIGAGFNGLLQVRDSEGNLLADFADMQGVDGGVTFAGKSGETYIISLHDAEFRGDRTFIYRLAITPGPRVLCTRPAFGQRGTSREVEFIGMGVATGRPVLESIRQAVDFPQDPELATYTHALTCPFGNVNVTIPLSDLEEHVRVPSEAIKAPLAVTSDLTPNTDRQQFSWTVEKDEHWSLEVQSQAIGGRLDVSLAVLDPEGKMVVEIDDLPGTSDAGLAFKAAAGGNYTGIIRSMATRDGAADEIYRLQIRRSAMDFQLTVPQQISIPLGGKGEITVQAARSSGFESEIALSALGLPAGITPAGDWTIPAGMNELKVTLQSAPDAAVIAGIMQIQGTGKLGDANVACLATAPAAGNLCPRSPAEQRVAGILLAVTMKPPFEIKLIDRTRQREVHRGSTNLAEMEIVRKDGFAGEIHLEMAAAQARYLCGSRGWTVVVPPETNRVIYPTWMSERLGTEFTIRMATQGVAGVLDPKGNRRYLTQPSDAQITMIMEGALLKLTATAQDAATRIGQSLLIPVSISRSAKLPLSVMVELEVPDEIAGLLHAEPLVLPLGKDRGELRITTVEDDRLKGHWLLNLRATALQDGKWPVISETELPLVLTP
ncbi:MAG: hypothetical protein WD065_20545 [Planctomycetaceae bacterium]